MQNNGTSVLHKLRPSLRSEELAQFPMKRSLTALSRVLAASDHLSNFPTQTKIQQSYPLSAAIGQESRGMTSLSGTLTVCIYICFVVLLLSLFFYTSEVWPLIVNNLSPQSTSPPR